MSPVDQIDQILGIFIMLVGQADQILDISIILVGLTLCYRKGLGLK